MIGIFAALTSETVQVICIFLQTDPEATNPSIGTLSSGLLVIAAAECDFAYVYWKQRVSIAAAVGLFLFGFAGFSLSSQFNNAIVAAFFPRTYVMELLYSNFLAVAVAGAYLPLFSRFPKRGKRNPTDSAGQSSG